MTDNFEATVCWFHDRPLVAGDRLKLKHTTRVTPVVVESVEGIFDVNALECRGRPNCARTTSAWSGSARPSPLALDTYKVDRITGSFVLIDDLTIATVAAGMVGRPVLQR